jgi:hypothetical protein
MNPACDVASDELIAFTEEELPERRMKQLEAHVPSCPRCQERLEYAETNAMLLRETIPQPTAHARHDLLVRLYQDTGHQTDHPNRTWTQVVSLTSIGGTFVLAAVLLWSGIGDFIDSIPRPFQQASQDQTQEWVTDDNDDAEHFETAPMPAELGDDYPLYDYWVRSGIRVIVYQSGESNMISIEVSQFPVDDAEPPGYMEQISTVEDVLIFVDDPSFIREIRWTQEGLTHHLQMYASEPDTHAHLSRAEVEEFVQTFLEGQ